MLNIKLTQYQTSQQLKYSAGNKEITQNEFRRLMAKAKQVLNSDRREDVGSVTTTIEIQIEKRFIVEDGHEEALLSLGIEAETIDYAISCLSMQAPEGVSLKVGDRVTYTNRYGVKWGGDDDCILGNIYVIGFCGEGVHISSDCFWTAKPLESLEPIE